MVTKESLLRHPVRKAAHWGKFADTPLEERFAKCPEKVVEYLHMDNAFNKYPQRPRAAQLTDDYRRHVREALLDMPAVVKKLAGGKLAGICFVHELGGSAFTESLYDDDGKPVAAFVVLDVTVMDRKANDWFTWRENDPFADDGSGLRIEARIEEPENDNRRNALRYILLHELGHVVSVGERFHPDWQLEPSREAFGRDHDYMYASWFYNSRRGYVAISDHTVFPQRRRIRYYRGPDTKTPSSEMIQIYEALEKTNFPSLYGSTNPFDDFAEAFATYVHAVIDKRPWAVRIVKGGKTLKELRPCWGEERCAAKEEILEDLLGSRPK